MNNDNNLVASTIYYNDIVLNTLNTNKIKIVLNKKRQNIGSVGECAAREQRKKIIIIEIKIKSIYSFNSDDDKKNLQYIHRKARTHGQQYWHRCVYVHILLYCAPNIVNVSFIMLFFSFIW